MRAGTVSDPSSATVKVPPTPSLAAVGGSATAVTLSVTVASLLLVVPSVAW